MSRSNHRDAWFDERVESYVDGLLPIEELEAFEARLGEDERLREDVSAARLVVSVLRSMPEEECPSVVTDRVLEFARSSESGRGEMTTFGRVDRPAVRRYTPLRLVRAATFVAAACLAIFMLVGKDAATSDAAYSDAEVQRALKEAKFALALVSDAGRDAGRAIRTDAVAPVSEAMNIVLGEPTIPAGRN